MYICRSVSVQKDDEMTLAAENEESSNKETDGMKIVQ